MTTASVFSVVRPAISLMVSGSCTDNQTKISNATTNHNPKVDFTGDVNSATSIFNAFSKPGKLKHNKKRRFALNVEYSYIFQRRDVENARWVKRMNTLRKQLNSSLL